MNLDQITDLDLYKWLSPLYGQSEEKFNQILSQKSLLQCGLFDSKLQSPEFQGWLTSDEKALWCTGIHGAGKTVFTTQVIDYLQQSLQQSFQQRLQQRQWGIAYIYFDANQSPYHQIADLTGQLWKQLIDRDGETARGQLIPRYHEFHDSNVRPSQDEYLQFLREIMESFDKVFIIIDAWDGDSDADVLLAEVGELPRDKLRLMVVNTSRPIMPRGYDTSRLEIRADKEDMSNYIEQRIGDRLINLSFKEAIKDDIIKKADGMFLIVRAYVDFLLEHPGISILEASASLQGIALSCAGDAYRKVMDKIEWQPHAYRELEKKLLQWVFYAVEPLTLTMVQHALAIEARANALDENNLTEEDVLRSLYATEMISIDSVSGVLEFNHYTVRRYLANKANKIFPGAQQDITKTCLTYLLFAKLL